MPGVLVMPPAARAGGGGVTAVPGLTARGYIMAPAAQAGEREGFVFDPTA